MFWVPLSPLSLPLYLLYLFRTFFPYVIFRKRNQNCLISNRRRESMVFVSQNPPTLPYTNWICMREPTCAEGHHLVHIWLASLSLSVLSVFSHSFSKEDSEVCGGLARVHCLSFSWDKPYHCCNWPRTKDVDFRRLTMALLQSMSYPIKYTLSFSGNVWCHMVEKWRTEMWHWIGQYSQN